jgi:cytidine deaminase
MDAARRVRVRAYAPYSRYSVGAALLARSGAVYAGCNMENAAFSPSVCAERAAVAAAVSAGEREFEALAVAGPGEGLCAPCGVCRQTLFEFAPALRVICSRGDDMEVFTLDALLPFAFSFRALDICGER